MAERSTDPFRLVLGTARGTDRDEPAETLVPAQLVRRLAPLLHDVLTGADLIDAMRRLRREADALDVSVVQGWFRESGTDDGPYDRPMTALLDSDDNLIALAEVDEHGDFNVLRCDSSPR